MTMKDVVKEMNEMTVKELSVIQDLDWLSNYKVQAIMRSRKGDFDFQEM